VLTHADLFGSSWRAVFLVNVPLAAAVLAISAALPEDHAPSRPRLDPAGTVLAAAGTALIVYPLIGSHPHGRPAWSWPLIALGVLILAGFGVHQRRRARDGRTPTVEPSLFRGRAFPAALAASTLFFAVMNGLMLVVVLYAQLGLHTNALIAGLTLLPWSAGLALASPIAGNYLIPRYGARVMYGGLAVQLAGLIGAIAAYQTAGPDGYPWPLLAALFVAGLGIGLFTATFFTTALAQVSPQENGSAPACSTPFNRSARPWASPSSAASTSPSLAPTLYAPHKTPSDSPPSSWPRPPSPPR
jgi:MFS family permease